MFCLIQRTHCDSYKPLIVARRASSVAFGDVGANAVYGTDQLFGDRVALKRLPAANDLPAHVGKLFGELIDFEFFESAFLPTHDLLPPTNN